VEPEDDGSDNGTDAVSCSAAALAREQWVHLGMPPFFAPWQHGSRELKLCRCAVRDASHLCQRRQQRTYDDVVGRVPRLQ
jgi:hypothetical protein